MKIVCDRGEMLDILTGVSKAVSAKSSIPAIEGILFRCSAHVVTLAAYDLEIGITTTLPADIKEPGDVVINARLLIEMVKKLDSDKVSIEAGSDMRITIKGNLTEFNIMGIPASDFPEMPSPETDDTLTVPAATLRGMINKTIYAVSTSDQKPVHTGTKFVLDSEGLTLVSVDGYRLALCRCTDAKYQDDSTFVVPGKTLSEVSKLISEDDDGDVAIGTARRLAVFRFGNYTVITRLLEGDFLDYKKSIPQGGKTRVKIDVSALYSAVERASLIISDRFKSPIKMSFESGYVTITCATALGNAYDEIPCNMEGEAVEIGFNNRYVLDALRYCGEKEVYLELNGSTPPMKVLPAEGEDFLFLVVPVLIKTAQ